MRRCAARRVTCASKSSDAKHGESLRLFIVPYLPKALRIDSGATNTNSPSRGFTVYTTR